MSKIKAKGSYSIISVIDIGSNSIKLLVVATEDKTIQKTLFRNSKVTKLGIRMLKDNSIPDDAISECMDIISSFKNDAIDYESNTFIAFATEALRNAKNQDLFKKIFHDTFHSPLSILTTKKEILLSHKGVISDPEFKNKDIVHIDIGGGSTEIIFSDSGSIINAESLTLGCISLLKVCDCSEPLDKTQIAILKDIILDKLSCIAEPEQNKKYTFIGTGGSILQLASFVYAKKSLETENIHRVSLNLMTLKDSVSFFSSLSLAHRKRLVRLDPDRSDSIIPGILILQCFLEKMGINEIYVSTRGIRYGAVIDYLEKKHSRS